MVSYSDLNLLAILVAAAASMALGMLYYAPFAFGKAWMELAGKSPDEKSSPGPALALSSMGTLLSAVGLAVVIVAMEALNWVDGLGVGALVAVAFVMPAMLLSVAYEGRPPRLFLLNVTYQVIAFCLMGAILGGWP